MTVVVMTDDGSGDAAQNRPCYRAIYANRCGADLGSLYHNRIAGVCHGRKRKGTGESDQKLDGIHGEQSDRVIYLVFQLFF